MSNGSDPPDTLEQRLREMNEALLVSAVRHHELAEQAQNAEEALRNSEVRYRRSFQTSHDGILILDAQTGRIIDANASISGMLALELTQLIGKELHEVGIFANEEENRVAFTELQQKGYIRYEHLTIRKRDGEACQVEFVSNVYSENDQMQAQCNVRDISERIRLEQEVKHQAERLAEESRRKDEFLALLSHELRNPLAPIRSATHLLRLQEKGSENLIQQQARQVIERQVTNLTRLVSDLLEISRVATGQIKLHTQTVDMSQIVQHGLQTARPLIDQQRHEVSVSLPDEPVWVHADPTRLEEVVVNLLTNAAKYTDEGGHIEVTLECQGDDAILRVRDSGIGIAPALLPHIFGLFAQGSQSRDRSQGGLGIGLNLVQRLVELHGGSVGASSEGIGRGSEFIVRFPLAATPGVAAAMPVEQVVPQGAESASRVLVVDDNIDGCTMLAHFLRLQGYAVQTAYKGTTGLEMAEAWRPDAILLDIGLPGLDGYEIARRVRATLPLRNTKLVAITGYGQESDVQLAREAGFDAHMVKPVDPTDILKLLASWNAPA